MSVEKTNLFLGQGELFFKRESDGTAQYMRVGNLKGPVTFTHEVEYAEQQPGNRLTVARRDKISEKAMLVAGVADFKISQLIAALGQSITTSAITATTTMRVWEELTLKGTSGSGATLSRGPISVTSVVVTSMDQSIKYTNATHYSLTSTDKIVPLTSTIANKTVMLAFDYVDASATRMAVGDKLTLQVVDLKFTHKLSDGKFISIEIPKATVSGGLEIPFSDQEYTTMNMTFAALGDMKASPGKSLYKIVREA